MERWNGVGSGGQIPYPKCFPATCYNVGTLNMEDVLNKNEYTIVDQLPLCDLHHAYDPTNGVAINPPNNEQVYARYDAQQRYDSRWAYMCEDHFTAVGVGLGTGKGQRLILRDFDEYKAIQDEKAKQPKPDVESLLRAAVMGDTVETSDGCEVEPDGECSHGLLSPLRELGLI